MNPSHKAHEPSRADIFPSSGIFLSSKSTAISAKTAPCIARVPSESQKLRVSRGILTLRKHACRLFGKFLKSALAGQDTSIGKYPCWVRFNFFIFAFLKLRLAVTRSTLHVPHELCRI